MKNKKFITTYLIFIIFFIGYFPFLKNLYVNCDGQFYLSRIESIYLNFQDGIFLPNIQSGNMFGYGYLIDLFYPCIFYYIPALLRFIFPINICLYISLCLYKVLFIYLTYNFGNKILKDKNMVVKFILLYYSNFIFLYDILIRECFSEYIASLILPIFFLGLYDLFKNNRYRTLVLSMSLILGTHLLTLYICCFITFICFILDFRKNKFLHIKNLFKATLETIIIGSYFLVPFIYYFKDYKYKIEFNLLRINSLQDCVYIIFFIIFLSVIYFIYKKKNINIYLIIFLILTYICSPLFPIKIFSFLEILQFKSRLYIFLAFFICLYLSSKLENKKIIYILKLVFIYSILLFIIIVIGKNSFSLEKTTKYNGYTGNYNFTSNFEKEYISIINGEYLPINLDLPNYDGNINLYYDKVKENLRNFDDEIEIIDNNNFKIEVISNKDKCFVPKLYYPLYKVYQEENEKIIIKNKDGYTYLENVIPNEKIILYYSNSNIQYISFIISLLYLVYMIFGKIYYKFKTKKSYK